MVPGKSMCQTPPKKINQNSLCICTKHVVANTNKNACSTATQPGNVTTKRFSTFWYHASGLLGSTGCEILKQINSHRHFWRMCDGRNNISSICFLGDRSSNRHEKISLSTGNHPCLADMLQSQPVAATPATTDKAIACALLAVADKSSTGRRC